MKLVAYPNTPQKQVFAVTGPSATFGSSPDNPIYLEGPNVSDYQASLTYADGVWLIESLDDKKILCGNEASSSLKLKVGLKFSLADVDFLVLDVIMTEAKAPSEPEQPQQMQPPPGGALQVMPNGMQQQGYQVAMANQQWGVATPGTFVDPYSNFVVQTSDTLAKLGLIFAVLGPLILGIGEIIGLILSVISISRHRNTVRGTVMAWLGVVISLLWCVVIGLGLFYFMTRDAQVHNETNVVTRLEKACMAEYYIKYALLVDDDQNMSGEYVSPDRFLTVPGIDAKARELGESPMREGYNYYFENISADTFTITAVPQVYNVTGKHTYWVNEEGIIVFDDLKGSRYEEPPLAKIEDADGTQAISTRYEKELSEKILSAAEQNFKNEKYDVCQQILDNLKTKFPYSTAMARLNAVEKENAPFLMEAKAARLYSDAMNYINTGRKDPALVTLRDIAANFPNTSTAQEAKKKVDSLAMELASAELKLANSCIESNYWNAVEESLRKIEEKYPEAFNQGDFKDKVSACRKLSHDRRDNYAMNLLKTAENLEMANETVQAYNAYLQIKEVYSDTPAAKGIDTALKRLNAQMDEKTADNYIAEIMKNVALSNEVAVINMISLLKNGCAETKAYKRAKDSLERIRRDCQVSLLHKEIEKFLAEKNYRSALDRIDHLLTEKPEELLIMKDKLEDCLVNNFEIYFSKGEYDDALATYDRYMSLSPTVVKIERSKVDECYYMSGKRFFQQGDIAEAEKRLEKCYSAYIEDPEYNFLAGRVCTVNKHWETAARHLLAATGLDESYKFDLSATRAYVIDKLSFFMENKIIAHLVANMDFRETINNFRLMKIRHARLSVTNDVENVSNVNIKVDREATSGDLMVTLAKEEKEVLFRQDSDSYLDKDISFRMALKDLINILRAAESAVRGVSIANSKQSKESKDAARNALKLKADKLAETIRELKIINEREIRENEALLKLMDRDISQYNAMTADLKSIMAQRNIPVLKAQLVKIAKKTEMIKRSRTYFRRYVAERNKRNEKMMLNLTALQKDISRESATPNIINDFIAAIQDFFNYESNDLQKSIMEYVDALKIEIDLSSLIEYLPKDKTVENKQKADEAKAVKAAEEAKEEALKNLPTPGPTQQ